MRDWGDYLVPVLTSYLEAPGKCCFFGFSHDHYDVTVLAQAERCFVGAGHSVSANMRLPLFASRIDGEFSLAFICISVAYESQQSILINTLRFRRCRCDSNNFSSRRLLPIKPVLRLLKLVRRQVDGRVLTLVSLMEMPKLYVMTPSLKVDIRIRERLHGSSTAELSRLKGVLTCHS